MMDRDKVINALEYFLQNRICLPHLIPWAEISDALALLKEQEPIHVIQDRLCEVELNVWERKGFCPKCHQIVLWSVNRLFCGFCGQAVKWNADPAD